MKKNKMLTAIGLLTALMVFGFQNCSKVGVQDLPSVKNGKASKDGSAVDTGTAAPIQDGEEPIPPLPSDNDLRAKCLKESSSGISGPEVVNLRGIHLVESDNLSRVEDVRGIMVIRGKTTAAKAKLIRDFRGILVVCGMQVEDIDNTRGIIALVNSKAAHVNNARGIIRLLDSELGSLTDFRGIVKDK